MPTFHDVNERYRGLSETIKNDYIAAAHFLPFSGQTLEQTFDPAEIKQVNFFLDEMRSSSSDPARRARAIATHAAVVEKLLKLAKVVS